jgi:hypothetical protein
VYSIIHWWTWFQMKNGYVLVLALVLLIAMIGLASAQPPSQVDVSAGNAYNSGSIYVDSTPPTASAILDGGVAQLITPGTFSGVSPGLHSMIITKPGFSPIATSVTVSTGTTQNVVLSLIPVANPGGLSISSTPSGAAFTIDDISEGKTSQVVGGLAPGSHKVTIAEAGYEVYTTTATVTAGQVTPVSITLVAEVNPPTGDLQVGSTPSGAAVFLNGDFKGNTPVDDTLDINDLSPGTYTLMLTRPGYEDYTKSVDIEAGAKTQFSAVLQPAGQALTTATAQISSTPSGAEVYINNVYVGITPLTFMNVAPGQYAVELRLAGYNTFSTTGEVTPGQNVQVFAALSPSAPVTTPTTKASASTVMVVMALGITSLAGILMSRRKK